MISRFAEALELLRSHFLLFAAIVFTVWLPGNILLNYVAYNANWATETGIMKMSMWIEAIFGPIYIGALIFALFQIKSGRTVTYREAMAVGIRKWGALFAARFVAGLFILLGLIALIVPGVMLAVRYSLLDAAVVIEDKGISESRARSVDLTSGRRWQIFWSAVLFFVPFIVLSFVVYLPLGFIEPLNIWPVEVVLDCIVDIAYVVIQIVIFLFYWESVQEVNTNAVPLPGVDGCQA